jgi:hypothetical protein
VPSKKYKASQASLQKVRDDSARLAQQVASLNDNLRSQEQKSATLQQSLDNANNNLAGKDKTIAQYQDFFNQQQNTVAQVSDQLKGAMSQAGLSGDDVQQENNIIYVRLDEDKIFKKNSMAVTPTGKQALNSLAQTIKSRSDINVYVANGDSANAEGGVAGTMPSSEGNGMMSEPKHKSMHHHKAATSSASASGQTDATASAASGAQNSTKSETAPRKPHRKHSEGGMTYNSNLNAHGNRAWALKQARMYAVSSNFLQNGIPKVNLSMEKPAVNANPQNSNIRVIITPVVPGNPMPNSSANAGSR